MSKKIVSLLLAVVMLASMLPGTIATAATTENIPIVTESTALLSVEEPWANPGGTVDVNIVIAENPGVLGALLTLKYDENLTLISAEAGEAWSTLNLTRPGAYTNICNFVWDGVADVDTDNGTILKLCRNLFSENST